MTDMDEILLQNLVCMWRLAIRADNHEIVHSLLAWAATAVAPAISDLYVIVIR